MRSSLTIATVRSRSKTVNGSAAISEAVCNASSPPAYSNTPAIADISTPHTIFTNWDGCKLPKVVMLAKIYVAESADVTRNVKIRSIARIDISVDSGRYSNV